MKEKNNFFEYFKKEGLIVDPDSSYWEQQEELPKLSLWQRIKNFINYWK